MGRGRRGVTIVLGIAGTALVALVVVAAVRECSLVVATPLLVAGVTLMILAVVHERLQSVELEAAGTRVNLLLRDMVDDAGPGVADELSRLGVADLVFAYDNVHRALDELRPHAALRAEWPDVGTRRNIRIALQDDLIAQATIRTQATVPDASMIDQALRSGSMAARAVALGIALAHPTVVELDTTLHSIERSLSGNQQYHALLLLEKQVRTDLPPRSLKRVRELLDGAPWVMTDPDRAGVATRIRETITKPEPSTAAEDET